VHATASRTGQANANRLLIAVKGLKQALYRYRLPMYSAAAAVLDDLRERLWLLELWRSVFGEEAPVELYTFDLQVSFAHKIDNERFPICMWYLDACWNDGLEFVLDGPIPFYSYGVPWEVECVSELVESAQPVVAMFAGFLAGGDGGEVRDGCYEWWAEHGYDPPDYEQLEAGLYERCRYDVELTIEEAQRALWCLPAPLKGLAMELEAVTKYGDNVFLTMPDPWWRYEYDQYGYCWCADCIERLTAMYGRAMEQIEAIEAYRRWYDQTKEAELVVVEQLRRVMEQPWRIENGALIYE